MTFTIIPTQIFVEPTWRTASTQQGNYIVAGNELLLTHKGALTEQYVYQQLHGKADFIYYWSAENSTGEIDFLVQRRGTVLPIEVKAEENLKSRSLRAFVARYPGMHGIRLPMSDYRQQYWMTNIPLYAPDAWL